VESQSALFALLGVMCIGGLYIGHAARKVRLPSLIGYMCLGLLLGPSCLELIGESTLDALSFITELALGFVAFSIGSELSITSLKKQGKGLVYIILSESFLAFFVTMAAVYLLTRDAPMALLFGAMAPASAPAGTVAVIQEYKARGSLTKALYAVVGFDDGLAIVIFGFASALAKMLLAREASGNAEALLPAMLPPLRELGLSLIVGGVLGLLLWKLLERAKNPRDMFVLVFGAILIGTGLSIRWHLSLILTNMVIGFVLANTRREILVQRVSEQLLMIMPLLFILFFGLAGAHLNIAALPALGMLGVIYVLARSSGLIAGARLGARLGKVEDKVRKYIGLGILSQAGVAIGLSLILKHELSQIGSQHALHIGSAIITTITATCIVFEILGPILTKIALKKAGEIPAESQDKPS